MHLLSSMFSDRIRTLRVYVRGACVCKRNINPLQVKKASEGTGRMTGEYVFTQLKKTNKSEPVFEYIINVPNLFMYKWNKQ